MSPAELTFAITAAANAIAEEITDVEQLELLSAALGQLSSTLSAIVMLREISDDSQ